MDKKTETGQLFLKEGRNFQGKSFGFPKSAAGEVVFNTGMVGYPDALSDPSYRGQILVLTYPFIGNYGVPGDHDPGSLSNSFESDKIQISGLIVSQASLDHSHWNAAKGLQEWLYEYQIPAISGIDTRGVTKCLREKGSMLGKILLNGQHIEFQDPNTENLVSQLLSADTKRTSIDRSSGGQIRFSGLREDTEGP